MHHYKSISKYDPFFFSFFSDAMFIKQEQELMEMIIDISAVIENHGEVGDRQ